MTLPAKPRIIDKWLHVAQDGQPAVYRYFENRYDDDAGAQGKPRFIVLHIQQGSSRNSWNWFHVTTASSTVMCNRDGSIWRLVDEKHGPWTNGDDYNPTNVGHRLTDLPGNPNIWTLSIETEGFSYAPNDFGWESWPHPQPQLDAVVWQIHDWMTRYQIPLDNVIRHKDVNTRDKQLCPGDVFFAYVINRLRAIANTSGGRVDYVPAHPVTDATGKRWDGKSDLLIDGLTFHGEVRTVHAGKHGAKAHQWASTDAGLTRGTVPAGEPMYVLGWVKGEAVNKDDRWWIGRGGSRIHVLDTVERPGLAPQQGADENPYDKVINGVRFHAVNAKTGASKSVTAAVDHIKVHKYADPVTAETRAPLKKGEIFHAQYWVYGKQINGENRWWVTTFGSRVNAGGTIEKP